MQDALCRWKHWLSSSGITGAAATIGLVAWGGIGLTPLAAFLPLLWAVCPSKRTAFIAVMAYYLAASRVIPQSAAVFFGESNSLLLGLLLWIAAAAISAAIWAALWTRQNGITLLLRLILIELLLILPPIGIIGWTNPILGAAILFPGMKWAAIFLGLGLMLALVLLARRPSVKTITLFALLAAISGWAHGNYREPETPDGWIAYSTSMGKFPNTLEEIASRVVQIGEGVRIATKDGFRVVIFPEQILGRWQSRIHAGMLYREIGKTVAEGGATVILGAEAPIASTSKATNTLVVFDRDGPWQITSRQPVPVSMWKPWASDGIVADWMKTGVREIAGVRASFSLCYEDFLSWPILTDFLLDKPQVIVSAANGWWVRGTDEQELQLQHIKSWGKIFGVPVLRALNAS